MLTGNKGYSGVHRWQLYYNHGMKEQTRRGTCIPTADRIHTNIVVLNLQTVYLKQARCSYPIKSRRPSVEISSFRIKSSPLIMLHSRFFAGTTGRSSKRSSSICHLTAMIAYVFVGYGVALKVWKQSPYRLITF